MKTSVNSIDSINKIKFPNDTLKTIYARRAVRKYKNEAVDKDLVEQLLNAGRMAPSALNQQPWKFYVLTEKGDIKVFSNEISKAAVKGILKSGIKEIIDSGKKLFHFSPSVDFFKKEDHIFYGAPVVILITSPKDNEWASLDVGMCSQNIMLAAKSLGLDTCPVGLAKFVEQTEVYLKLNISPSEHVNLAIVVGYGDENPEIKERIKENAFFFDHELEGVSSGYKK